MSRRSRDQARLEEEQGRINRLFNAVTRGLMKFTSSPLTDSGVYFSKRCAPNTWEEDLALAEAELAKLPIKCEEALDAADRATQH